MFPIRFCAILAGGGDIARNRVWQRGLDVRLRQLLLPCALSVQNIAEALYENMTVRKHIRQLAHLLCISDRLIERH